MGQAEEVSIKNGMSKNQKNHGAHSLERPVASVERDHLVEAFNQFEELINAAFNEEKRRVNFSGAISDQQSSLFAEFDIQNRRDASNRHTKFSFDRVKI